jgi:hypothetical protein
MQVLTGTLPGIFVHLQQVRKFCAQWSYTVDGLSHKTLTLATSKKLQIRCNLQPAADAGVSPRKPMSGGGLRSGDSVIHPASCAIFQQIDGCCKLTDEYKPFAIMIPDRRGFGFSWGTE